MAKTLIIHALIKLNKILSTLLNLLIAYKSSMNAVNIQIKLKISRRKKYLSSLIKESNLQKQERRKEKLIKIKSPKKCINQKYLEYPLIFFYLNKYKKLKKFSLFKNKCNYLKKDKILSVVDLAKEAIGKTINKIAKLTIMKKERLG